MDNPAINPSVPVVPTGSGTDDRFTGSTVPAPVGGGTGNQEPLGAFQDDASRFRPSCGGLNPERWRRREPRPTPLLDDLED
jgi:hypothetical protein